jgi:hypothetical protein
VRESEPDTYICTNISLGHYSRFKFRAVVSFVRARGCGGSRCGRVKRRHCSGSLPGIVHSAFKPSTSPPLPPTAFREPSRSEDGVFDKVLRTLSQSEQGMRLRTCFRKSASRRDGRQPRTSFSGRLRPDDGGMENVDRMYDNRSYRTLASGSRTRQARSDNCPLPIARLPA